MMQTTNDPSLENWHDYEVESPREIVALLRGLRDKNQLVHMLINGGPDASVSSIVEVDPDSDSVILDKPADLDKYRRLLGARRIDFETSLDKIRIMFSTADMGETNYQGTATLRFPIPESLIRLQRREYYRMPTPVGNPVRVTIPMPPALGGPQSFPIADISCGGIAVLDNKLQLGSTIGASFDNCKIELPESGTVTTTLQIRNFLDMTLLNSKTNRRVGCEFIDLSRGNLGLVQRYITKLERERNSRFANLG